MTADSRPTPFVMLRHLLPGLILASVVAWLGLQASTFFGETLLGFNKSPISGIMMAILLGLLVSNVIALPPAFKAGITFSLKRVLRLGIILLGIRLSLGDVLRLGTLGVPLIVFCITGAILVTRWLSARLNIPAGMGTLIAVGTSICGATAIVATGPAIEAKEEEIAYAVANITVFGILAMLLYPFLAHALFSADPTAAGLFLGTSIHETAQVAGGGLIYAEQYAAPAALDVATVTKLVRNVLMVAIIPLMAYLHQRQAGADGESSVRVRSLFPVFILGFLAMALVRTLGDVTAQSGAAFGLFYTATWDAITGTIKDAAELCLAVAMAAVGLGTRFSQLRGLGLKPFYVGFAAALTVGGLSLLGIGVLRALGLS